MDGAWTTVVVDDLLPVTAKPRRPGLAFTSQLAFCRSGSTETGGQQLWVGTDVKTSLSRQTLCLLSLSSLIRKCIILQLLLLVLLVNKHDRKMVSHCGRELFVICISPVGWL
jgi:hypothetical protein